MYEIWQISKGKKYLFIFFEQFGYALSSLLPRKEHMQVYNCDHYWCAMALQAHPGSLKLLKLTM